MLPPIAVFAYNRPHHLAAVLQSLERSMEFFGQRLPLYIYCDAPKDEKSVEAVECTRKIATVHSRAYDDVKIIFRETNLGFKNIVNGISELTESHGKVIVVEDDIIVSPDFLPYMTNALNFYENHPEVFMISGFMYFGSRPKKPSTFGMRTSFIWGWGTWKRAWDHFCWEAEGWQAFVNSKKARYEYDFFGTFPFSKILKETMSGETSAWDPQWVYAIHKNKAIGIHPYRSLTWNCGIGGGVHGQSTLDQDPLLCKREYYVHGNLEVTDFLKPQLPEDVYSGRSFSSRVKVDKKAMRSLAFTFLKERFRTERRKRKLIFKMIKQGLLYPFTFR